MQDIVGLVTQTMHKTDQELKTAVTEELQYTPSIDASGVEVQVNDGTVTLSGEVASLPERLAAKHAAMRVGGVKNVTNKTSVRAPITSGVNDQDIAQAADQILAWAVDVPPNAVTADVRNHKVTLSGQVTWEYQRNAAARAVTFLKGVTRISNEISLVAAADRRHQGSGRGRDATQRRAESAADHDRPRRIRTDAARQRRVVVGAARGGAIRLECRRRDERTERTAHRVLTRL
ncbi:hypothetical protein GCM10027610_057860 [Dactylosporangium cerinum]